MNEPIANLWAAQHRDAAPPDAETLSRAEARLRRRIFRRDAIEYAAGLLGAGMFVNFGLQTSDWGVRIGCAAVVLGMIVVLANLWRRRPPAPEALAEPILAFHRLQLVQQRDALASVWRWYLGPLLPGMALFLLAVVRESAGHVPLSSAVAGGAVAAGIVAGLFWGIHRLNLRAARSLDARIEALDRGDIG